MVWKIIAGIVVLALVGALGVQTLIFSNNLGEAEEAQAVAEATAERESLARQQADSARQAAEAHAENEVNLRATAEARQEAAEQQSQEDSQLRATAEADATAAQAQAARESRMRANAEADLQQVEADLADEKKTRALVEAETSPTLLAIITGEVTIYVEDVPDYAAEGVDSAVSDMLIRLQDLEPHGARVRQTRVEENADIYVGWVRDYGEHTLGTAVHQTSINVSLGGTNCYDEWQAFDVDTVEEILWHELGHAFGYGHSDNADNIMFATRDTRFVIEQYDEGVIPAGWYWQFPVCSSGIYGFGAYEEDGKSFDYAVLSHTATYDDYWAGTARPYSQCSMGREQLLAVQCRVTARSWLVIENNYHDTPITMTIAIARAGQSKALDMEWDPDAFYYDEQTLAYYRELFAEG